MYVLSAGLTIKLISATGLLVGGPHVNLYITTVKTDGSCKPTVGYLSSDSSHNADNEVM